MSDDAYAPRVERGHWRRHHGSPGRLYWRWWWSPMPYLLHRWNVIDDRSWFAGFARRSSAEAWVHEYELMTELEAHQRLVDLLLSLHVRFETDFDCEEDGPWLAHRCSVRAHHINGIEATVTGGPIVTFPGDTLPIERAALRALLAKLDAAGYVAPATSEIPIQLRPEWTY